jgi:transposase
MARPTYDELLSIITLKDRHVVALEARVAQLEKHNAELQARVAQLEKQLEEATRANKRQAAPFSRGSPKNNPKKPGRKSGKQHGPQANRQPPKKPDQIIDVPLPQSCRCGGRLKETKVVHQYQVEIPRKPITRRFDIHLGKCCRCGQCVQPRHPLQTSDAVGAAAVQFGPDLQALMALMKNVCGLTYGDIVRLLQDGFGIQASRGAVARVVLRVATRAGPVYAGIGQAVRTSDLVYPDETGWKVAARLQWLWVFVTKDATLYVIRPSRGGDVLEEVLGLDYQGRLTHDGWAPYDSLVKATHQQCLAHLLRRARELQDIATGGAVRFPRAAGDLLMAAIDLRARRGLDEISPHGFLVLRGRLEKRLDRLLDSRLSHAANRRFRKHLAAHRDELLRFLYDSQIEPYNWPAEQAIRPAVVNRKVFGGNRMPAGARAQEILSSLFATGKQRDTASLSFLSNLICSTPDQRLLLAQQFLPTKAVG